METILASRWNERRPDVYDVVVVGSGYGGAIPGAEQVQRFHSELHFQGVRPNRERPRRGRMRASDLGRTRTCSLLSAIST